jgi:mannose-6-phosphate isomerase-like protein (cupin superfamily)
MGVMKHSPINLAEKFSKFSEHWSPKIIGHYNGNELMVVKVKGEFVWHSHADTDDFFMVLKGNLTIKLLDGDVNLSPGEIFVVPKGIEHCPYAEDECHLLLIEPPGTPNTGNEETAVKKVAI